MVEANTAAEAKTKEAKVIDTQIQVYTPGTETPNDRQTTLTRSPLYLPICFDVLSIDYILNNLIICI